MFVSEFLFCSEEVGEGVIESSFDDALVCPAVTDLSGESPSGGEVAGGV